MQIRSEHPFHGRSRIHKIGIFVLLYEYFRHAAVSHHSASRTRDSCLLDRVFLLRQSIYLLPNITFHRALLQAQLRQRIGPVVRHGDHGCHR